MSPRCRLILPIVFCLGLSVLPGCARVARAPAVSTEARRAGPGLLLPGLSFLSLGMPQRVALTALRQRGYDCNEDAGTPNTVACLPPPVDAALEAAVVTTGGASGAAPPPGADEVRGDLVLGFAGDVGTRDAHLVGVQLQPQAMLPGKEKAGQGEDPLHTRFTALSERYSRTLGSATEVHRPGVVARRHMLPAGAALTLIYYDPAPQLPAVLMLEQVLLHSD